MVCCPMFKNVLMMLLGAGLMAGVFVLWPSTSSPSEVSSPAGEEGDADPVDVSPFSALYDLVEQASQAEGMEGAAIGCCVLDESGAVVFDWNAGTALIPASSLKTLTTATALEVWGPDHRLETQVRATAAPVEGVIDGDIVLLGAGDPMLSLGALNALARDLRVAGVSRVTGRVIGDGRLFAGSIFDGFWNWGDIGNGYGSGVSGLNLQHNRFTAKFWQGDGSVGDPAELIEVTPEVPGVRFLNETVLADAQSGDGVEIHDVTSFHAVR